MNDNWGGEVLLAAEAQLRCIMQLRVLSLSNSMSNVSRYLKSKVLIFNFEYIFYLLFVGHWIGYFTV